MIKLYSPFLYIARGVALLSMFAVNALGVGHFHPPSDVKTGLLQDFAFVAVSQDEADDHEGEHKHHDPGNDSKHGCDLCWLQAIAKTAYLPQSTTIYLQNLEENVVRQFPSVAHRSFLETLSILVRAPPTLA